MHFINKTGYRKFDDITHKVNHIIFEEEFSHLMGEVEGFEMSSHPKHNDFWTGEELALKIRESALNVYVRSYRSWKWWSRVYAYYSGGNNVYLNSRKFKRSEASIANTIVHEGIHCLDAFTAGYFGHGGNSSRGKHETAPWQVGAIVEQIYRDKF